MLITAVHWFLIAIWHVAELNSIAIIAFTGLAYLAYRYRHLLEKAYHWLMKHKLLIMLAAFIFQLIMLFSAELLIRRDAAVVFTGAFKTLKESSISSYLTRNPNNVSLFLYERFFFNVFGESGLWVMQALNIVYTNVTALILYKGCQKYFSQKAGLFSLFLFNVYRYSAPSFHQFADFPSSGIAERRGIKPTAGLA